MRLAWVEAGRRYRVARVAPGMEGEARRAGIVVGETVLVVSTLSGGPIGIESPEGRREVGAQLANRIDVSPVDDES